MIRNRLRGRGGVGVVLLMVVAAAGQLRAQDDDWSRAAEHFQNQEWEEAARAYTDLTARHDTSGLAWFRLGAAHYRMDHFQDAVAAWKRAHEIGFAPGQTEYNLASALARSEELMPALEWLGKAVESGFANPALMERDSSFVELNSTPDFHDLVKGADRNARPCIYGEEHQHFDFWVGSWDVFNPRGRQVGTNRITKTLNGCMLLESWSGGNSEQVTGHSINFYNPVTGKWEQIWTDGRGGVIDVEGRLVDGSMVLEGKHYYLDGHVEEYRMKFTPQEDGSVRQFIEQSRDGGESWYVWFDGKYVRQSSSDSN